jgi:glycosyltransferase involved in cell wall biosynthesis
LSVVFTDNNKLETAFSEMKLEQQRGKKVLLGRILRSKSPLLESLAWIFLRVGLKGREFNPIAYSLWQGGLISAGINPIIHAAVFGIRDRILGFRGKFESMQSESPDTSKDWVLIVTHDLTRTGAPILALNLVSEFSKKYNVATLSLGPGELKPNFIEASNAFYQNHGRESNPRRFRGRITKIANKHEFAFAIVNSVESAWVISSLIERAIPAISLVHEFPLYSVFRESITSGLNKATKVVFSSSETLGSFHASGVLTVKSNQVVRHQGACLIPQGGSLENQIDLNFRSRVGELIRPQDANVPIRIIGAGLVQYRKGVDLFISLASRIIQTPGFENSRFLWIGDGYDANDITYGAFLTDQMTRSKLEGRLSILPANHDYSFALSNGDCLALTSRLDPFPNVAIDALREGIPVACFEGASGFSEFALTNEALRPLIAPYLDVEKMALGITSFFKNRSLTERSADKSLVKAEFENHFSFAKYASALEELAKDAR